MSKYSHARWGLGLLVFLLAVLLAILPSRVTLLLSRYRLPIPQAVTWTEVRVPEPAGKGTPRPLDQPAPSSKPRAVETPSQAPAVAREPPQAPPPQAEQKPGAFTLDFGTFVTAREAEEVEHRLNQLGASTLRLRKRSDSALYTVKIGEFRTPAQAKEPMEQLRLRHPSLPLGKLEREAEEKIMIVVDALYPLREAVALAGRLRTEGLTVRIETARGAAPLFTLRLAKTYDLLRTAQEKSREFRDQGFPNAVVPVEPASSP